MTKEQKVLVVKLRDQGMTFAAIAEKLDALFVGAISGEQHSPPPN